jgi:glycosyltransferase involved in cell wall biosynthesis
MKLKNNLMNTPKLSGDYDIVVFSHLRWEFVIQRPQHIINRLAKDRKILFIEEPIPFTEENKGTAHTIKASKNITVLQPRISWDQMHDELEPLVTEYMDKLAINEPILWFYSAGFGEMVKRIDHSLVVYDVMDELSAFKGASPRHLEQERELLKYADVVFTGGKSLYESKSQLHDNVHCFPSSVDRVHFEKALKKSIKIPTDLAEIRKNNKKIAGFYGVIDERIDLDLLAQTADLMQEVSFVMIGPVVKINEADLPRRDNIFYLGSKPYAQLPEYLKGIDIAIMPFAMNESTKFISPTKTLEFMAALKPIISTPIYDVVRDYQKEVKIVHTAEEFKDALTFYLQETPAEKKQREKLEIAVIERTSWDNTVSAMKGLMAEALDKLQIFDEVSYLPDRKGYTSPLGVANFNFTVGYEKE